MIWLITICILCALIYYVAFRPLSYWKNRGVMHITPLPILGNSSEILFRQTSILDYSHNLYKTFSHERYYGSHQFNNPVLHIKDIDLIKKITVKSFDQFVDRNGSITEDVDPLIGKSLLNLKGQRWRDMRAILSPSFTSSKMKMMFELISECAKEFTEYFEKQNKTLFEVEMKDIFTRYTNDAIATVAFGFKCNSVENKNNEFYKMAKEATKFSGTAFLKFFLYSCIPKLSKIFQIRLLSQQVTTFFKRILKDTLYKREKEGIVRPDMIHLLMQARKDFQKYTLSDEDVVAQALLFLFGGFDTSSTAMSFLAYELAMNEIVQTKLQKEIEETLINCNGKLTYEAIHKMKYMDMVVAETLRKWPPVPFIERICTQNFLIEPVQSLEKPLIVEKGTLTNISIIGLHRDPKHFPDPDIFDPERFNDENKHTIEASSYMPFGSGPRNCIASRFALMETKTLMFYLISKFTIVKTSKTPYPIKLATNSFNIGPSEGFWLGLKPKNSN